MKLHASFMFGLDGLSEVLLAPTTKDDCLVVEDETNGKYGKPDDFGRESDYGYAWAEWHLKAENMSVRRNMQSDHCWMSYKPLTTKRGQAL